MASSGARSKQVGKEGEKELKALLVGRGWLIADKETQGLAGDDLFARDPNGIWWSCECKKTKAFDEKFVTQAMTQAGERAEATKEAVKVSNSIASILNITFDTRNWRVFWKPRLRRLYAHSWLVFSRYGIEVWDE